MIFGTWNLAVYASRFSRKGSNQAEVLCSQRVNVWLLTEIHSDWDLEGQSICFSPTDPSIGSHRRLAAISTSWKMYPLPPSDHPGECSLCMARLVVPETNDTILAVSSVLPWRGSTPFWRRHLGDGLTFAEAFDYVLQHIVARIHMERRDGEPVVWGGDFNQGLSGRDYVGTMAGREALLRAFGTFDLSAPTADLPAMIVNHPAIDHIAFSDTWRLGGPIEVLRPAAGAKPLSDHAMYVVSVDSLRTEHGRNASPR